MMLRSPASPTEWARHQTFVTRTLGITFASLAVTPVFLAFHGAPTLAECVLLAFGLLPLAAAMVVARTGRLMTGHLICFVCFAGVGITLFLGVHAGVACALAWLMLAQIEAAQCFEKRITALSSVVTMLIVLGLAAASIDNRLAPAISPFVASIVGDYAVIQLLFTAHQMVSTAASLRAGEVAEAERWRVVSETLGDGIISLSADGSVTFVSAQCETMVGAPKGELTGRALFEHIHVADRPLFLTLVADAARSDGTLSATLRLRTWDDRIGARGFAEPRHLWVEVRARKLDGTPQGSAPLGPNAPTVIAVLRDVSIMRQRDLDLETTRQGVEAAIRAKDHFLANMSHELRTPLNAIIGFSEMLGSQTMRPIDQGKQREYARVINQSGQHLLSVVNSILDMSKIQSGTFSIIPEPFDIIPLIDLCCDMVKLKAQDASIRLVRDYPSQLAELTGDKRACKQILINLLSNAVKFTPEGGQVTVKARPEGNVLAVTVADTGIGISAEDIANLGDPFFQARSSLSRPYEGTGLGLSVVRGLIGLHGGSITIESEPGKGTNIVVRLPLDCRRATPTNGSATIELIGQRKTAESKFLHDTRMHQFA